MTSDDMANRRLRVFLCYAHEDRAAVAGLYRRLLDDGFQPWMDKRDLLPGQQWELEIPKAVRQADVVLACLSPRFVAKAGYGHKEIKLALDTADQQPDGTIFVIPLRLEACEVLERLRPWHWCDYFDDDGYDLLLRALRHRADQLGLSLQPVSTPAPVHHPDIPVPTVVRSRLNPLFPITLEEWRDVLLQRNEVFGRPADYWCYVRPGTYAIGGWEPGDAVDSIRLPGFWVAKYPITVQQYRQFLQAGGYADKRYWTPHGWQWRTAYNNGKGRTQPFWWGDHERFNAHDNQPVVGVSWYEVAAFARWLAMHLSDTLPSGYTIRMPTEAEWEAAAAYDEHGQRRTYPWGEAELDASRADFGKNVDEGSAPVGERPDGAAACGAQDMVGGMWEAATSSFAGYPARSGVVVEDFATGDDDVPWRGHAYYGNRTYVRGAARDGVHPGRDGHFYCVRLFVSPQPS